MVEKKEKAPAKKTTTAPKETAKKGLTINVVGADGAKKTALSVPEELFNVSVSDRLLAQYVRVYLVNQRQGTRKVKSRGEIQSSTRKIYKQKGTGRARHGAKSAPIFVGGGVAHGPSPKEFMLKLNKKQKRKALLGSLTNTVKNNTIFVFDDLGSTAKTKDLSKAVTAVFEKDARNVLIVYSSAKEKSIYASAQNLKNIEAVDAKIVNAYDVLNARRVAFTRQAMDDFINFRTKN